MAPSDHREGAAIWFAVIVGLVILLTILIGALIIGPDRSSEGRGELRIDRPIIPNEPRLPTQPFHRQVA